MIDKTKTYYLAGPMTNIPQFNYPAFDAAAEKLRAQGYSIRSPAEMDSPETRAAAMASVDGSLGSGVVNGETWGDFLARDVKLISDSCQGIITLPDWYKSRGARLEVMVATLCKLPVYKYNPNRSDLIDHPSGWDLKANVLGFEDYWDLVQAMGF